MLYAKSSEKPIIYLSSKIKNEDIIMIELQSINKGEIKKLISNSAISTKKAQKQLLQRQVIRC
ncbi:MAG: hypothetical protein AB8V32_00015 [Francisella endosymbiont of Hyalomma scupense]